MNSFRAFVLLLGLMVAPGSLLAMQDPLTADPDPLHPLVDQTIAPFAGFVRFPAGDEPPDSVLVRLETSTGTLLDQRWTNRGGRFEFTNVACGSYVIAADVAGYRPVRLAVEQTYYPQEGIVLYMVPREGAGSPAESGAISLAELQIPEVARKEYTKGLEATAAKKPDRAVRHFRKAIELYADYDDAYIQLALVHLSSGAYPEAQQAAKTAIAHNEKNSRAHALLGVAQREQKQPQEAVKALEQSIRLEENSWFSQFELGKTYLEQQELESAYRHLRRAHELNPDKAVVHLNLYNVLILRNEFAAAAAELDDFLALFPQHPQAARARQQRQALTATQARRQP